MNGRALVNTDPALRRAWHPVARSAEVGPTPHVVTLLGEEWVLVRIPDGAGGTDLAAFVDRCPHRLAPLSAGHVDGTALRCGYHGWCFDVAGACTEIPALGGETVPPRARATVPAALREQHGLVFLAPEAPVTELLAVPEAADGRFVHGTLDPVRARVGAGLMIDNFLDMAHFPFVHAATIGTAEAMAVPDLDVTRAGFGMTVRSRHWFPNHEDPGVATGERPLLQERILTYEYRAPFLASLRIDYVQAGGTNVVTLFVQPERDDSARLYATIHRDDLGDEVDRMPAMVAYEAKILDEDLALQEQYRDRRLPLDLTEEVHIKADRATIELRRILADLVAGHGERHGERHVERVRQVTTARHRWLALAAMCLALSIVVIDNTILAVAIPDIAKGLDADEAALQWISTAYGLVLAGLLLPLAVLGDKRGRKGFLLVGLVLLGVGSCAAAFAGSWVVLAVARGVMGVGGACTMPATLSLLGNIFDEAQRGRAIAIWAGAAGSAAAFGPVIGGILLSHFWWGSVFLVNVPMAVVAIGAVLWLVPTSRDPGAQPVDRSSAWRWWGALTAAIFAIIEGPQRGWTSPIVIGSAVVAVLLFWAFARNERRSPAPLIPEGTARDPRLRWGAATVFALFFGLLGVQFVLTQWLQGPLGRSPLGASIYFVPNALASVGAALANPRAVARFGHGVVATGGLVSLAVGAAAAAVGVGIDSLGVVVMGGVLIGAAVGIASASAIEMIMSSAPPEKAGSAAGVNETLVEAAGAFGVAVLGSVFAATGSYAWPLPVASVVAVIVAFGVKATLVRRRRASPRSTLAPPA